MTTTIQTDIETVQDAIEYARLLGHDVSGVTVSQDRGFASVKITHRGSIAQYFMGIVSYDGYPTIALEAITRRLSDCR